MKLSLTTIFICLSIILFSQDLTKSRASSYYTYIFKISNKEAKKIYNNALWKFERSYFHTLIDSFPTDSIYKKTLPQGHYLKLASKNHNLIIDIATIQYFDVLIKNNSRDLNIQVVDTLGNAIPNAEVKVNNIALRFDKKSQCYRNTKPNKKGLLSVSYKGMVVYNDLARSNNNSLPRRALSQIVYGKPVRYLWLPVYYIINLPIDGVKSIINHYPQNTIYRTRNYFVNCFNRIACRFDDYYCDEVSPPIKTNWGYMIFNKPKYLPNDTVKFKAYVLNRRGYPINKPVEVILFNYNKKNSRMKLGSIYPDSPGNYVFEFKLSDSLNLSLDRSYSIYLEDKNYNTMFEGGFKYEDYELSGTKLSTRLEFENHYIQDSNILYISATNENNLPLLGAKAKLVITTTNIQRVFANSLYIKDTLLEKTIDLEPSGETKFQIPDSVFPNANFYYQIKTELQTAENDNKTEYRNAKYFFYEIRIEGNLKDDYISFIYLKNGINLQSNGYLTGIDRFGNIIESKAVHIPYIEKVNPYYAKYTVRVGSDFLEFDLKKHMANLECFSERNKDSVRIIIKNPRTIPFNYNIYRGNSEIKRGLTTSLSYCEKSKNKKTYHLSLQYLWGGVITENNYDIPIPSEEFKISVEQPSIIFLGKKTPIKIKVVKSNGKPAVNVNLTAFSLTDKFSYSLPEIETIKPKIKGRKLINNFKLNENHATQYLWKMNYDFWQEISHFDSIPYYQFIFPRKNVFTTQLENPEHSTQFAPFYFENGEPYQIHIIYVDNRPVYFSWASQNRPYSFKISSGKHTIQLRTYNKLITLKDFKFEMGKKTILSLSDSCSDARVVIKPMLKRLEYNEKVLATKYTASYRDYFSNPNAYLNQMGEVFPLYQSKGMLGPIFGNYVTFHLLDQYELRFEHEPNFEYDFNKDILKMRCTQMEKRIPEYLNPTGKVSLTDNLLTEEKIITQWNQFKKIHKFDNVKYYVPNVTQKGNGVLLINDSIRFLLDQNHRNNLHTIIQSKNGNGFYRVYQDIPKQINDLKPGNYQLILLHLDGAYYKTDSLSILGNGKNFYQFNQLVCGNEIKDSKYFESLIWDLSYSKTSNENSSIISRSGNSEFYDIYTGSGMEISGIVSLKSENEPLPGVSINIKGTAIGTITDQNGFYKIKVPYGATLVFSFIGCVPFETKVDYNDVIDVKLEEDLLELDEVIVIGYGIQRKSEMTGSRTVVSNNIANLLQGTVAGAQITGNSGATNFITIRGISSLPSSDKPLVVIDGIPFWGDLSTLNPNDFQEFKILKDASATAIYGAKATNGVILIQTKAGSVKNQSLAEALQVFELPNNINSIRKNFSDYGYWQPKLYTDKKGEASFSVTFPDDVTRWNTFVIAMDGNDRLGINQGSIQSFKPLLAEIKTPRFLVERDSAIAIGKISNYTVDSIDLKTEFKVNDSLLEKSIVKVGKAIVDSILIVGTGNDSICISYSLETGELNYIDGEKRYLPMVKSGVELAIGEFYQLNNDTTFTLENNNREATIHLTATSDQLDLLKSDIASLIDYKHECNEQLASKLKALLAEEIICKFIGDDFKKTHLIKKLIRLLTKNQNDYGGWGWWGKSETSLWVTKHVLEALNKATENNYSVTFNKDLLAKELTWELSKSRDNKTNLDILLLLKNLNVVYDYQSFLDSVYFNPDKNFNAYVKMQLLKQFQRIPISLDSILQYKQVTMLGNYYFSSPNFSMYDFVNGNSQTSLLIYKLLKNDSSNHSELLNKMRNYFFENKRVYTYNTYESANLIETILPDLLTKGDKIAEASLLIDGDFKKQINTFPFDTTLTRLNKIQVTKTGSFPVYFTSYSRYWDINPKCKESDFKIESHFSNNKLTLEAGKKEYFVVELDVKKDAKYLMIEIPIPAGCSYNSKNINFRNESHREYFKDKVLIYCGSLKAGHYSFSIDLLPRFSGKYTLNPAKVELMYFPTFNANNELKRVIIN